MYCNLLPDAYDISLQHNSYPLTTLQKEPFENIMGEGENAANQHFLLFPQCFLTFQNQSTEGTVMVVVRLMLSFW